MRSIVGPSRTRRPRRANGSIRKGWTRSSGPGSRGELNPAHFFRKWSAETPGENALLRMQPVLRLIPHHGLRAVDDTGRHLLAALYRQAVHEDRVGLGVRHQVLVDAVR